MNNQKNIIFQIPRSYFQFKALDKKNRARDCQIEKNANVFTFYTQTLATYVDIKKSRVGCIDNGDG